MILHDEILDKENIWI